MISQSTVRSACSYSAKAGIGSNAFFGFSARTTEKNSSAVAYSTVYPLAMFLRILTGQALLLIFWAEL